MSNVIELRLLDHCVHPMCYIMDVMTNLRQYYSNSHKITKREDISNPFEVLERQTLEVENIVEKNKYLTIFFSVNFTPICTLVKNLTHQLTLSSPTQCCQSTIRNLVYKFVCRLIKSNNALIKALLASSVAYSSRIHSHWRRLLLCTLTSQ